jgi:O-antigen/teichoic acid export membrane protein
MIFTVTFIVNAVLNFVLGVALGAILGPAEYGRFATITLAATTLGMALFDWLRLSAIRFSGDPSRPGISASLDGGYLAMIGVAVLGMLACMGAGWNFGAGPLLLALAPFLSIANARCDFCAAQFRARDQGRAFAVLYFLRHALTFTFVIAVAMKTQSVAAVIGALAAATLGPVILLGAQMRTRGAHLREADRRTLAGFVAYAKPIVVSTVLYQLIGLINRQTAIDHFGLAQAGKLALATDLGFRLFLAVNAIPESLLFREVLARDRVEGRAAAERQLGVNGAMVLALMIPLAIGYFAMMPTFQALVVPPAFRGDFIALSLRLTPGFLAFCILYSVLNPVFQLAQKTWPLTIAAAIALGCDLVLLRLPLFSSDAGGLALAHSVSLVVGCAAAAAMAMRRAAVRPSLRDVIVILGASATMAALVRPLNDVGSHWLAAFLAMLIGGATIAAALFVFDVAGLRGASVAFARGRSGDLAPLKL